MEVRCRGVLPVLVQRIALGRYGVFNFSGSGDTITIHGELGDHYTPIFGFVICGTFDLHFKGGTVDFAVNAQPFQTKDGTAAAIPANYAVAVEMLRQDARPVILWEDRYTPYVGVNAYLEDTRYYRSKGLVTPNGSTLSGGNCVGTSYIDGISYGSYVPLKDPITGEGYAYFDYNSDRNKNPAYGDNNSGQLVFNHKYNGNVEVTADFTIEEGVNAGVRFGSQGAGEPGSFQALTIIRKWLN